MPPLIQLLRPHQWTKNTACLAGVVFGGKITNPSAIGSGFVTLICFCLAASAMYIFNDLQDLERDRQHPKKRFRPLASGQVAIPIAVGVSVLLLGIALVAALQLSGATLTCLIIYIAINLAYSLKLKHIALFDVGCIATGFVLRLLAGIYAIAEIPTASIILCTFFLAMFLGFAKRRTELAQLQGKENLQRPVLSQYSLPFLDSLVNNAAVMAVVSYALFSTNPSKNPTLVLTLPIVQYAILYYKSLIFHQSNTEEPDQILLRDRRIIFSILLWLVTYIAIFYGDVRLFR